MILDTFDIFGQILGALALRMGIWYYIWDLGYFGVLSTISGILALSLKYRSRNSTRVQGDDPAKG